MIPKMNIYDFETLHSSWMKNNKTSKLISEVEKDRIYLVMLISYFVSVTNILSLVTSVGLLKTFFCTVFKIKNVFNAKL
jgi:hypothetical protein